MIELTQEQYQAYIASMASAVSVVFNSIGVLPINWDVCCTLAEDLIDAYLDENEDQVHVANSVPPTHMESKAVALKAGLLNLLAQRDVNYAPPKTWPEVPKVWDLPDDADTHPILLDELNRFGDGVPESIALRHGHHIVTEPSAEDWYQFALDTAAVETI